MNIAIYCSSRELENENISKNSKELVYQLTKKGVTIVYGGSTCGLMGIVADTAIENGGKVIGVSVDIPKILSVNHHNLTQNILAKDMPERRSKMIELSDGFIALPGGTGTLDEISEVICYSTLNLFDKPVIIFDIDGFYAPLKNLFSKMEAEGMTNNEYLKNVYFTDSIDEIIKILKL